MNLFNIISEIQRGKRESWLLLTNLFPILFLNFWNGRMKSNVKSLTFVEHPKTKTQAKLFRLCFMGLKEVV